MFCAAAVAAPGRVLALRRSRWCLSLRCSLLLLLLLPRLWTSPAAPSVDHSIQLVAHLIRILSAHGVRVVDSLAELGSWALMIMIDHVSVGVASPSAIQDERHLRPDMHLESLVAVRLARLQDQILSKIVWECFQQRLFELQWWGDRPATHDVFIKRRVE